MEINEFIAAVADLFEETPAEVFKADTVFKELEEWSSLVALSVIAMVYEEYNTEINGNDIRSSVTLEDLYNRIKPKG